ncbi:MAG TPA: hypothetical protein VGS57_18265 [Thermoanaerobaculia bacterium]|jgi:hypothetical protein|nr:hypothetical protein [Thermoanaerobaculia bacterium]
MSDDEARRDAAGEAAAAPVPRLSRRAALAAFSTLAAGAAAGALPPRGDEPDDAHVPACRDPQLVPNVVVVTHEGRRAWFLDDLLAKRAALVHFTSAEAERAYPVLDRVARVRALLAERLGARLGEDVLLLSIATDVGTSPHALAALAAQHGAGRGWLFVSAEPADVETLWSRFFMHAQVHAQEHAQGGHDAGAAGAPDCSRGLFRYGNATLGLWGSVAAKAEPQAIAERLAWVLPPATPLAATAAGPAKSRRRGPLPLVALLLAIVASTMTAAQAPTPDAMPAPTPLPTPSCAPGSPCPATTPAPLPVPATVPPYACPQPPSTAVPVTVPAQAADPQCAQWHPGACTGRGHPCPQGQLPGASQKTVGDTTTVVTGTSLFAPSEPFVDPPGTNLLPNVYTNAYDSNCVEIPNTLPSTPTVFYNLHDGEPTVSAINRISPTSDLERILDAADAVVADRQRGRVNADDERAAVAGLKMAVDILEGNPIPNRAYSGFPLLHYIGPLKYKKVTPIYDDKGNVTGGNVDVHQIWYDNHIESDTALLDPTVVAEVPWTITYTLDVLDRGKDDFSPFIAYFDTPPNETGPTKTPFVPGCFGPLLIGMDQTFFPIEEGTRTVLKIKMAPAKYFNLSYTWGWRWHPPRIQVIENATKKVGKMTTLEWEQSVFGLDPRRDEQAKLAAIAKIGDLAPTKVMWRSFRTALDAAGAGNWLGALPFLGEARLAFEDWQDRTRLPRGVSLDKDADLTVFFVDNTIYAQFTDGGSINFPQFQTRGAPLKVTLLNGDYFDHAYMNIDFGGGRGWENQFKSSVKVGGSGCWFTFGRAYLSQNLVSPVTVPAATPGQGADAIHEHHVEITFAFDPSRRLRFYQFDPTHHDVAIFSVH